MQSVVILNNNSLYGNQCRKDNIEICKCKTEHWMQTGYDDHVLDYWRLRTGIYIANFRKNDGLDADKFVKIHYLHV